jgi:hypothetical protein
MSNPLPKDRQDRCKFCGEIRTEDQGNNGNPRCPVQGCPGQHVR